MSACKSFLVSGRVQGVFFRASTRDKALSLGLNGYAKNLSDGRVEVVACGSGDALDELEAWLHEGPRMAEVSDVQVADAESPAIDGFETR